MTAIPTQGYSLPTDFQAILEERRKSAPKPPKRTYREPARNISATEFITRNNRANYDEQKNLIRAYMGHYSPAEPHGTQLDAARRTALLEIRPVPESELGVKKAYQPNVSGMVAHLLSQGRDLMRRLKCADDFDYSEATIIAMKRQLRSVADSLEALNQ